MDKVCLASGEIIPSGLTVWFSGVIADRPAGDFPLPVPALHLPADKNVFMLGDTCPGFPLLAQVAVSEAKIVAHNIKAQIYNLPLKDFNYKSRGELVSLGRFKAVGVVGPFHFSGFFAWWVWRTVYLFKFLSVRKRLKIMGEWTKNLFTKRS